jgi:hypothetical protein
MTAAQLVNKYPSLYTTSEFISVFTAAVTGAYSSQINPIRIATTNFLKADLTGVLSLRPILQGC